MPDGVIPQIKPEYGWLEQRAVSDYLESGRWLTEHDVTRAFERKVCELVGARHAFAVPNGTLGLYLALWALDCGELDIVVTTAYTMVATVAAISMLGAVPVLVDVDPHTMGMDFHLTRALVDSRQGHGNITIMLVHINGRPAWQPWQVQYFMDRGVRVIEDACQAFGAANVDGACLGTMGDIGVYSFSPHKIITTGQGGMVVTNDDAIAEKLGQLRNFGREGPGRHNHKHFGINLKFTDLQATFGLAQLESMRKRKLGKLAMWALYRKGLRDIAEVQWLPETSGWVPWYVDILVPNPGSLQTYLAEHGIETQQVYPVLTEFPAYLWAASSTACYPQAQHYAKHGLWLPSSLSLSDQDIRLICYHIHTYFRLVQEDS